MFVPQLSWLWWNVFGFLATVISGYLVSRLFTPTEVDGSLLWSLARYRSFGFDVNWQGGYLLLGAWFLTLLVFIALL